MDLLNECLKKLNITNISQNEIEYFVKVYPDLIYKINDTFIKIKNVNKNIINKKKLSILDFVVFYSHRNVYCECCKNCMFSYIQNELELCKVGCECEKCFCEYSSIKHKLQKISISKIINKNLKYNGVVYLNQNMWDCGIECISNSWENQPFETTQQMYFINKYYVENEINYDIPKDSMYVCKNKVYVLIYFYEQNILGIFYDKERVLQVKDLISKYYYPDSLTIQEHIIEENNF